MSPWRDIWCLFENQTTAEASRFICRNCRIVVGPTKTFKELISMILEVRSMVVKICGYECFISGNYNSRIVTTGTWFIFVSIGSDIPKLHIYRSFFRQAGHIRLFDASVINWCFLILFVLTKQTAIISKSKLYIIIELINDLYRILNSYIISCNIKYIMQSTVKW